MNFLKLTPHKLNVEAVTEQVTSPKCGAVSVFIGTTRDNFEGKTVLTLEYEAYESMAIKGFETICKEIRNQWSSIENIAIYHRLGTVPVKEASIIIAISSPHRLEAMLATQYCIDSVKKNVPIWKKETYSDNKNEWKENKEFDLLPPKIKKAKFEIEQEVKVPFVSPHLLQIKATNEQVEERIQKFIERKREEINKCNIRDFCVKRKEDSEDSCARIDAVLVKRKDSKGHLQVNRVFNTYSRDRNNYDYLTKHIPKNGIEERLENMEVQLSLHTPVPRNVYKRLKQLENRLLYLESTSPEYIQFWDKNASNHTPFKKKIFSIEEIDHFIADLEKNRSNNNS